MATDEQFDKGGVAVSRRDFLYVATGALATVGALAAVWPFIDQMNPSADVRAMSTTEIDLEPIELGQRITVVWQSKPVFISHRTQKEIDQSRSVDLAELRDPETDEARTLKPEWLVVVGICTHLGCIPLGQKSTDPRGNWNGWFCPCHGSHYDTAARIRQGPAPRNLDVPPYEFINKHTIRIG